MNFAPDSYPVVDHPNTRNWKSFENYKWQTDVKTSKITSLFEVWTPKSPHIYKGLNFELKLYFLPEFNEDN